ncbi:MULTISPECIES: hypothetical protein [16SrI (Aster yellows group)]|uniref:Uncharacterized protein n=1 Tax='Santalum album' aster yellows phytoplasma TaxID=2831467 RepID=A0ABS5LLH6_9MOLU|nr:MULTISPECIES: hypothetical protein [16SrI (Aster yellows group)]MBS2993851.1 hypothetical protein ['Santalum album' aster yellows phytoplasma]
MKACKSPFLHAFSFYHYEKTTFFKLVLILPANRLPDFSLQHLFKQF